MNPSDDSISLTNLKYGDNLENSESYISLYIETINTGEEVNLYFGVFSTSWKNVSFSEKQSGDFRGSASTGKIDVSKPGIIMAKMY